MIDPEAMKVIKKRFKKQEKQEKREKKKWGLVVKRFPKRDRV